MAGAVLLADGRVLLPIDYGRGMTVLFDPATDTFSVTTPPSAAGCFSGGALLADGPVLLLPGLYWDLLDCRIWDPATDTYTLAPELAAVAGIGQGAYLGGCVLPDGHVVSGCCSRVALGKVRIVWKLHGCPIAGVCPPCAE